MQRSFLVILASSLLLLASPSAEARRAKRPLRLRAMTFNIRFDFQNDGRNRWEHRVDSVAQRIQESQAQVVCLQEDKAHQVNDLKTRLAEFAFVGRGRNASGSGERCSILFNRAQLRLKEGGDFWLSDTPLVIGSNTWGDKYPRKVTWALLESLKTRQRVLVLNTHLPEGKNNKLREKGLRCIQEWLKAQLLSKRSKKKKALPAVLVGGDFNEPASSPAQDLLTQDPLLALRDVWEEAKPVDPRPGTYGGFNGMRTKQRIDWLLVGGMIRVLACDKLEEPIEGRYPSDHYPVIADLEIR